MSKCPCGRRATRLIPDPFDVDGKIWACDTCAKYFEKTNGKELLGSKK